MAIDLILRGGEVIDPAARRRFHADVAIRDGQIAEVGARLVAKSATEIDVSGMIVGPGWVDAHAHVFNHVKPSCVDADSIGVRQGVVAVVDAGSFGASNAAGFYEYVVKPQARWYSDCCTSRASAICSTRASRRSATG